VSRLLRVSMLLILGIAGSAAVAFCIHQYVLRPAQARDDVFTAFKEGAITPDADGVIVLPPSLAAASVDGKAYVTRESQQATWILFVKNHQGQGYLFCTAPGHAGPKVSVGVNYPKVGSQIAVTVVRAVTPWCFEVVNGDARHPF
jgi:hypothetical protein